MTCIYFTLGKGLKPEWGTPPPADEACELARRRNVGPSSRHSQLTVFLWRCRQNLHTRKLHSARTEAPNSIEGWRRAAAVYAAPALLWPPGGVAGLCRRRGRMWVQPPVDGSSAECGGQQLPGARPAGRRRHGVQSTCGVTGVGFVHRNCTWKVTVVVHRHGCDHSCWHSPCGLLRLAASHAVLTARVEGMEEHTLNLSGDPSIALPL